MLRKLVCVVAVLGLSVGVGLAEELKGRITKVADGKITFQVYDKETKKFEDAKTYDAIKSVKVNKMENDKKVVVEGGLKASMFSKIDAETGVRANINVTDGNVTEVTLLGKKTKNPN